MYTNDYIRLCLTDTNPTQVIYGVEGDLGARWITADIVNDKGEAWEIPSNATPMIRYSKPDGTYGAYDTMENGRSAFVVDGSTIQFGLAGQTMTVAGDIPMELTFFGPSSRVVTTLPFTLRVYPSVAPTRLFASANYVNLLNSVMSQTAAYAAEAQEAAETVSGYETKYAYRELDPVTWGGNSYGNMVLRNTYLDSSTIWAGGNNSPLSSFIDTMLSLAARLSTDSSWTLLSGSYSSGNYSEYRKINGFVELRINYSTGAPASSATPLGTLPSGYRPAKTSYFPGYVGPAALGSVNVRNSGVVDLTSPQPSGPFYATIVFAPGA